MDFLIDKAEFHNIAKAMEQILKSVKDTSFPKDNFRRYAFTYNDMLCVTNGKSLIGIKTEYVISTGNHTLQDGKAYSFKLAKWNKFNDCLQLEEVEGIKLPANLDNIINFNSNLTFPCYFNDMNDWFAFNFRIANFNICDLEYSFEVIKSVGADISYSENGCFKVESNHAVFVCLTRVNSKYIIKPTSLEEVKEQIKSYVY
jgi:hypothetical protein